MALAIDIMHGCGLCNKRRLWLQPKVMIEVNKAEKGIIRTVHYQQAEGFIAFKVGCVIRVVKCLKEDWLVLLR